MRHCARERLQRHERAARAERGERQWPGFARKREERGEIALDLRPVDKRRAQGGEGDGDLGQRLLRFQLGAAVRIRGMRGIIIGDGEMRYRAALRTDGGKKDEALHPRMPRRLRQRPGGHRG